MNIKGINKEKCTNCLECVKECPHRLFFKHSGHKARRNVIFSDPHNSCIHCGHCVSVCPHNAVLFESQEEPFTFPGIDELSGVISFKDMFSFLRGKRSVRRYKEKPLPADEIKAVLSAMQYAPSASNTRSWEYIVITNKEARKALADEIIGLMKKMKLLFRVKWLVYPFLSKDLRNRITNSKTEPNLQGFLSDYEQGIDRLFFHTPCIIILHSPSYAHMAGNNAGIAFTYGMLAAQSRGLGTCWIGFAQEAFYQKKALKKRMKIPSQNHVYGVMTMGYPDVTYYRAPVRDIQKVQLID